MQIKIDLLATSDSCSSESIGGTSTVTITASQMPAHTHTFTGSSVTTSYESTSHTLGSRMYDNKKPLHLQRLFVFYRKYREWGREGEKHEIPDETCPDGVEQL